MSSTLPSLDVSPRADRLRAVVADAGCDAMVVTDLVNVRYLTGFTGSNAVLLVRGGDMLLVTDGRYRVQARDQLDAAGVDAEVVIARDPEPTLAAATDGTARLAVEADHLTWALQRRWADALETQLVPTTGLVLGLRARKDDAELDRLALAAAIADDALAEVRGMLVDGPSEIDVARALESEMIRRGADGPSFETIVASGPNAARPHARPSSREIGGSGLPELVVIDFGALVDGYHSDMTRTFTVREPTDVQQRMLEVVRRSQAAGVAAVRAGTRCVDVDGACRSVIDEVGWSDAFVHGTGHGIGLVIHEDPRLNDESSDVLEPGHCVTVEPGVYLPEHGGVRIEDSVVVTDDGCRLLTRSPYDPVP